MYFIYCMYSMENKTWYPIALYGLGMLVNVNQTWFDIYCVKHVQRSSFTHLTIQITHANLTNLK